MEKRAAVLQYDDGQGSQAPTLCLWKIPWLCILLCLCISLIIISLLRTNLQKLLGTEGKTMVREARGISTLTIIRFTLQFFSAYGIFLHIFSFRD